jgi:penicillin-binding protein 1C
MSDTENKSSTEPSNERSAGSNPPTQPGERLRKILKSPLEKSGEIPLSLTPSTPPPAEPNLSNTLPTQPTDQTTPEPDLGGTLPTQPAPQTGAEHVPPFENGATMPYLPTSSASPFLFDDDRMGAAHPSVPSNAGNPPPLTMPPSADAVPPAEKTQPSPVWNSTAQTIPPPFTRNIPLPPPPVNQVDMNATQVTSAAYQRNAGPLPQGYPRPVARSGSAVPSQRPHNAQSPVAQRPAAPPPVPPRLAQANLTSRPRSKRITSSCLLRTAVIVMFLITVLVVLASAFAIYQYFSIASTLPSVDDLRTHASQFETTRILDRNGNVLYELNDPNAGRRTYVTLDKISPYLIAAVLATEDKDYYSHPGFDPLALARSLWQNYTFGETYTGPGASTITQQLARLLLLSPTERNERTVQRKAREIVLSAEITRRYTKEDILEIYLNEIFYGNQSYGIEAAAETYFNTTAAKLTLGQAAFLVGLPAAPSVYDVYTNKTQTLDRFHTVIQLTYTLSTERSCIVVSTAVQPVCVDAVAAARALDEIDKYNFVPPVNAFTSPHWVTYIRALLEAQFDPQTIYHSGFTVYTTLDPDLQAQAEQIVKQQVSTLASKNVTDAALTAIRPATGEILAMVGSADFYDAKAGQVNMAVSPRQPGSSIKPLTYVAAFEKGWNPATVIWDVPSEFPPSGDPNDTRAPYKPTNYDLKAHGPVSVRTALDNSYNVPAVKALQFIGLYNPGGLIAMAKRMGITTLTRPDYGLALTLGGGEVTPLELTGAYAVFANSGKRMPSYAISKIVDYKGQTVFEYKPPAGDQVISAEHAFQITSILSDTVARVPMYGTNPVINLPFTSAVKTGTTNDFRDNWTLGYTPDLAVGVWVGNADDSPMVGTTGLTGAAPIWADFMKYAIQKMNGGKATAFTRPAGIVEKTICEVSGTEPSDLCPKQRSEYFVNNQPPPAKDQDFWQKVKIDTWTGLKASAACGEFTDDKLALNVTDPWAIKWIKETPEGKAWADKAGFGTPVFFTPTRECWTDDPHPKIVYSSFGEGQTITASPLDIYAVVDAPDFKDFQLSYGIGDNPTDMIKLGDPINQAAKDPTKIYSFDMSTVPPGKITLVIRLNSTRDGFYAKKFIHLVDNVATSTPTLTPTSTSTPTPTNTPTQTSTALPTLTPTSTATPTQAPSPTSTPIPLKTP